MLANMTAYCEMTLSLSFLLYDNALSPFDLKLEYGIICVMDELLDIVVVVTLFPKICSNIGCFGGIDR